MYRPTDINIATSGQLILGYC